MPKDDQAHTQAKLKGFAMWVELPDEEWPNLWKGMRRPVCPFVFPLYGRLGSGGAGREIAKRRISGRL